MSVQRELLAIVTATSLSVAAQTAMAHEDGHGEDAPKAIQQYGLPLTLMNTIYEGEITAKQMKQLGDIGVGVSNHLNGELTAVDGVIYSIAADGTATVAPDDLQAPYMSMLEFEPTKTITLTNIASFKALQDAVISEVSSINSFYAFKAKGTFAYAHLASAHGVTDEAVDFSNTSAVGKCTISQTSKERLLVFTRQIIWERSAYRVCISIFKTVTTLSAVTLRTSDLKLWISKSKNLTGLMSCYRMFLNFVVKKCKSSNPRQALERVGPTLLNRIFIQMPRDCGFGSFKENNVGNQPNTKAAAVIRERGRLLETEKEKLVSVHESEVIVRVFATGMWHTDMIDCDQVFSDTAVDCSGLQRL